MSVPPEALTPPAGPPAPASARRVVPIALQRVVKVRRDYNSWVASESLEDYALRYTPQSFRKWSELRVANTAFGAASFLVLEAVGATLAVDYGFINAFWAILATALVIVAAGWPISVQAARHGLDMDLLTRGAGFGYLGSTVTSLIYACFTFIFFALEAAVMAYALELAFDIPPAWGYLLCALVVLPLVMHGVTAIARLQVWTQPLWLALLVLPYLFVFRQHPDALQQLWAWNGAAPGAAGATGPGQFDLLKFGAATTVGIALITQMGEQADTLRFMPALQAGNRRRWWLAVAIGGPGWVLPGVLKMLGGALLAWLAIRLSVPADRAVDPNQMYLAAWDTVFSRPGVSIAVTAVFVVLSQLKINVTNAYAGSLAWSNFFARLTHSHPGRVVWVVFNTAIALMLMELDVFQALGQVLGLYSNIAISWLMAVVADLVINKPLGLSPPGIEFRRAYLYDVNPVGVGAMGLASAFSVAAHLGFFGPLAQAFSAAIAMVTAFCAAPLIAWATGGRYYLARPDAPDPASAPASASASAPEPPGAYRRLSTCCICERDYEAADLAHCPAYQGRICSLCCSLDARCGDLCKPHARLSAQWAAVAQRLLPARWRPVLEASLVQYLLLMLVALTLIGGLFGMLYRQELHALGAQADSFGPALRQAWVKAFAVMALLAGIGGWWAVLTHKSRQVAQEESNRQTQALGAEIASHAHTDEQLQRAKREADAANQAKSRYITAISHELRTPLNSIIGYAQLMDEDAAIPEHRRHAVRVIRRGGDHLLSLIEGTLDLARIESGKVSLDPRPLAFRELLAQLAAMFELQARAKGIAFVSDLAPDLPELVRADEARVRQVLINIVGNAVKFTRQGQVRLRVTHARELALFDIEDTGPGMSAAELDRIFEPFARGSAAGGGTGLGLTIARMLTELMGGEISVQSTPGQGTRFRVRMFLPALRQSVAEALPPAPLRIGYQGPRRRILAVDNEEDDRSLLADMLVPLGFELRLAPSGDAALALLQAESAPGGGGWRPDAVLMDLAMPGIDGWETVRRLRAQGLSQAPVAIVSANAFDRGLDNDVGVRPEDFVLKPVRKSELLGWLGRQLGLQWIDAPAGARVAGGGAPAAPVPRPAAEAPPASSAWPDEAAPAASAPADPPADPLPDVTLAWPVPPAAGPAEPRGAPAASDPGAAVAPRPLPPSALQPLAEAVRLGYLRGVHQALDQLDAEHPGAHEFTTRMRGHARAFELDALADLLARALDTPEPDHA